MERHLNLIKSEFEETEKRVFPRFPFCFLTFKGDDKNLQSEHVFEVLDISYTGMQLSLKFGSHDYQKDGVVSGNLHWKNKQLNIKGTVKWIKNSRLGVQFDFSDTFDSSIKEFLSIDNIVSCMMPLHENHMNLEVPSNLKYWLRADGPFEVFVWAHNDNELSKFQIIIMENFIEWEDGKGLKSGRVISKRDLETPLFTEDEYIFQIDTDFDEEKMFFATRVVENIPDNYLTPEVKEFLLLKLGLNK